MRDQRVGDRCVDRRDQRVGELCLDLRCSRLCDMRLHLRRRQFGSIRLELRGRPCPGRLPRSAMVRTARTYETQHCTHSRPIAAHVRLRDGDRAAQSTKRAQWPKPLTN